MTRAFLARFGAVTYGRVRLRSPELSRIVVADGTLVAFAGVDVAGFLVVGETVGADAGVLAAELTAVAFDHALVAYVAGAGH